MLHRIIAVAWVAFFCGLFFGNFWEKSAPTAICASAFVLSMALIGFLAGRESKQ